MTWPAHRGEEDPPRHDEDPPGVGPRTAGPAADVGRWFSSAGPRIRPSIVRGHDWGPLPAAEYGRSSTEGELDAALPLLTGHGTTVLTGAGMSTGSGLPDYRGPRSVPRSPMTYQEFTGSDLARRRYWARSTVGWAQFARAEPNAGHQSLARLGALLPVTGVITQNVDDLHRRAGSAPVVDLHGRLDRVRCLSCDALISRGSLHSRLLGMNPEVSRALPRLAADAASAPDGDAEVDRTHTFTYPPCALCGGMLKPDVVFFGETARRETVNASYDLVAEAGALLVLGSSLTVQSGLRFVRATSRAGTPVVIVNDGPTRGDRYADVRLHGRIEDVLGRWERELG